MTDQRLTTRRITGLAGLGTVILFGLGNGLWAFEQPEAGASAREVASFYADNSGWIVAGGSLSLLAVALFILFASGARAILREHEGGDLLATTAFGGAILAMATGIGAETLNMAAALRADEGSLTPALGRVLFEISYVLGYPTAGVGIGVLILSTAAVALRARALMSRWLAFFLIVVGLAFLTPLSRYLLAPSLILLAGASIRLLRAPAPHAARDGG